MAAILLFNAVLSLAGRLPSSTYYKRSGVVEVIPADTPSSWNSSSALRPDYLVLAVADPSVAAHRVVDTMYAPLPDHDARKAPATPRAFAPSAPPPPN
ncbi:hypothetical protein B0H11DRAFT_2254917 [Mycena galericulata]|nr:hypothetical protein B0H11DRAFT_2254917 [Mycena galericulata]